MHLTDAQARSLKLWLNDKLSHDSDADSDILADYVLALVRGDGSAADLHASCVENLRDFLQDGTERFVDDVLYAVREGTYLNFAKSQPANASQPTLKRPRDTQGDDLATREGSEHRRKHARRGGRRSYGELRHKDQNSSILPTGMTMHDALNAMAAMQQMMGLPPLKGMDQMLSQYGSAPTHGQPQRGHDYAVHSSNPRGPFYSSDHPESQVHSLRAYTSGRGTTPAAGGTIGRMPDPLNASMSPRRERQKQSLSEVKSNRMSNTTIVVEQIPDANLTDSNIRSFFSQFGNITSLVLHKEQKLAIVTYSAWEEAKAAYQSSKPIFDNRFVKVFWHRSNVPSMIGKHPPTSETSFDLEAFSERQKQAQERHDAMQKARNEAAAHKAIIDSRLREMEAERRRLTKRFATKTDNSPDDGKRDSSFRGKDSDLIAGLRVQLAKLEAEARTLGLDLNTPGSATFASARTRQHPVGSVTRGGFGSKTWSSRGRWAARGPAVRRLDNRSRSVIMVLSTSTYDQSEEALRRYLLLSGQLQEVVVSRHPERNNAAILVFKERYQAENLVAAVAKNHAIPEVGSVEIEWLPTHVNTSPALQSSSSSGMPESQIARNADKVSSSKIQAIDSPQSESMNGFDIDEGTQWD